jgi:pyruvate/2-oxoglutarate dehydrogenase complex dihydrolipoamide dehydrogenase (E3) component/uncharacterized membrane protein YdjX (TVP38/TMEM64 family)
MKRVLVLLGVAAAIAASFALGLDNLLTLDSIKREQVEFQALRTASPVAVAAAFFALYTLVTAVSLPGAALMTLAAGALFGVLEGTLLVSFASSIGATLAFLTSRYLFKDRVQARFGARLKAINDGVSKDGAFYLFTLRLVPAVPFFLINLLMGLTPIRARTFYWVSQVGMFPGTLVYVNAGTRLAEIESLRDVSSPELLASLIALGLFPWLIRGLLGWIKARKVYGRYSRPATFDRNLVVIGAGAAGLVSAYIAAAVKAKVTLIEAHKMGGDCLNFGCVPSKALIKSAKVAHQMRNADRYGLEAVRPSFSFRAVMKRVHGVIAAIEPHDSVERYTALGVEVLRGHATIIDPWTVAVRGDDGSEQRLTTRSVIIAAGSRPSVPPIPGLDDTGYVTSDTLWDKFADRDAPPARLVVLGGGPIGCELSQAFARLGSEVTQVEMTGQLLGREDEDVAKLARKALEASGVTVLTGHKALRAEKTEAGKTLTVECGGKTRALAFDELLVAVGRSARLTGYGLEELGIETERTVSTNAYLETVFPNIYAAGDVAGPYQFTHVAAHQAWYASVNALFGFARRFKADYRVIPWVTFTDPEIARVGLNERDAREQGIAYEITHFPLHELDRAIAESATDGFIKVLTAPGTDRILGVTIASLNAGEILAEYVTAMKHGLGLNKVLGTIHSYPTMAEANKYAAGVWKRAHAPQKLLGFLERLHRWRRG